MGRRPTAFRERDVTRLIRAAIKAGLEIGRVVVEPGRIAIVPRSPHDHGELERNEWDDA